MARRGLPRFLLPVGGFADQSGGSGSSTPANTSQALVPSNATAFDVYVDGTSGNDANSGLATGTALKTIAAVYRKFPLVVFGGATITVHLAGTGGFTAPTAQLSYIIDTLMVPAGATLLHGYRWVGPPMSRITPATGPATAALNVTTPVQTVRQDGTTVDATARGTRTRLNFSVAAPGWTVNDLAGSFLRIKRGANLVCFEFPITENGANTIIVDINSANGIAADVLATDTVEIVRPSVAIIGDSPNFDVLAIRGGGNLIGNFAGADPVDLCSIERVAFPNGSLCYSQHGLTFDRCQWGASGAYFYGDNVGLTNCVLSGGSAGFIMWGVRGSLPCVSRADAAQVNSAATTQLAVVNAGSNGLSIGNSGLNTKGTAITGCFDVSAPVSIYRSTGDGIQVHSQCLLSHQHGGTHATILGNGNTGVGIRVRGAAEAEIAGSAGFQCTLTGTLGDVVVDAATPISYGTGVGALEEVAGYNGNYTRRLVGTATAPVGSTARIYVGGDEA